MPNSTWRAVTNDALRLASLDTIQTDAAFDADQITKYQAFAKYVIRLGHAMLTVRARKHFTERRIELLVFQDVKDYQLDTGISAESLVPYSFFSISPNAPQSSQNVPLVNMPYEQYMAQFPVGTPVPKGAPTAWIFLPLERTDPDPVHRIRVFPTPDQNYTLQYKAKLNASALTKATDKVLWPPEYEHVLTTFAWNLIERDLGEGKEAMIAQLADKACKEVWLAAGVPEEVRRTPRTMKLPSRFGDRRYNSPMSVDPNTGAILD